MKMYAGWLVVNTCRLVVSATFVFSGVVKLIDPMGTVYKIQDYLAAMSLTELLNLPLLPIFLAILLGAVEFCMGIYLLLGIFRVLPILVMTALTLIYTPLTLWLALTDAVADCGCFGDALYLSNWQTFGKNILLLLLLLVLYRWRHKLTRLISVSVQWIVSLFSVLYALLLSAICLYGEPIADFRPYYVGQHIPSAMEWPEDPEELPEILDFAVEPLPDMVAIDTESLLADSSYTFLLMAPHLEEADDANFEHINTLYDYARQNGYGFFCLTASGDEAIRRWQDLTGAEYPFAFMDELTLKTAVRSNPGLMLLHKGTIVGKWGHNMLPSGNQLDGPLDQQQWVHSEAENNREVLAKLTFWYLTPLLILVFWDRLYHIVRYWKRKRSPRQN